RIAHLEKGSVLVQSDDGAVIPTRTTNLPGAQAQSLDTQMDMPDEGERIVYDASGNARTPGGLYVEGAPAGTNAKPKPGDSTHPDDAVDTPEDDEPEEVTVTTTVRRQRRKRKRDAQAGDPLIAPEAGQLMEHPQRRGTRPVRAARDPIKGPLIVP